MKIIMKKIKLLLIIAIVAIVFTSCSKYEESLILNNVYGEYSGQMKFDVADLIVNIIGAPATYISQAIVYHHKI